MDKLEIFKVEIANNNKRMKDLIEEIGRIQYELSLAIERSIILDQAYFEAVDEARDAK